MQYRPGCLRAGREWGEEAGGWRRGGYMEDVVSATADALGASCMVSCSMSCGGVSFPCVRVFIGDLN